MKGINIVLDYADPTNPIFVEIEDDSGNSINIGSYGTRENSKLMYLRITPEDIQEKE